MKHLKKEEYVYRDCCIRMSKKAMSDLMYAAIITQSGLPSFYGCNIYQFNRSQNAYNHVEAKVHIHPSMIEVFEKEASVKLKRPIVVQLNNESK